MINKNLISDYLVSMIKFSSKTERNFKIQLNQVRVSNTLSIFRFPKPSKSHRQSHSLVARRGQIRSRTLAGQFILTRFWCLRWRCHTPLLSTPTRGPPCASSVKGSSRASSGRACSAKVRTPLGPSNRPPATCQALNESTFFWRRCILCHIFFVW